MPGFTPITMMKPDEKDNRQGISSSQAGARLLEVGPNELPERKPPGLLRIFFCQSIHIADMYTPGLRTILQVEPVTLLQWSQLLIIALVLIVVDELHKRWHQRVIPGRNADVSSLRGTK